MGGREAGTAACRFRLLLQATAEEQDQQNNQEDDRKTGGIIAQGMVVPGRPRPDGQYHEDNRQDEEHRWRLFTCLVRGICGICGVRGGHTVN